MTVKRFPCRVGDSPRRSGVCPTTAWCGVRLTALEHPRCGHPHAPVVKCRGARTGRSQLLLEPAAVTVKRFPCRVGDSPRRSGVCPTTAWCGVRLTALEHPRCGHPHAPVVKCRVARTGRSQLLLEPAAVTVKRFPCRVGDSPRRSGVCPTTAWCGVRLTALEHPRCGHPHAPVVKCRGARTGRSQLLLEPAAVTVKRFPCRVGDSPRRSGVCPTTAWCGVRLTALEHPRCGHPHLPVVKCRVARTGRSAAAGARRGDGQTVPVPRGRLAASIGCVSHHRMVWGPPHRARTPALRPPTRARGQMSRCSDGSVAAAAGARRGDGQTVPVPRGRLAASIGCVSHHRMVWGPPHRARTPALRPPTLARGQMSRCSDGSVAAAAGARRGDGQTVPAPRGRLAASIGCVSHHRMVWGPPHRARTPALRPPTLARGQMSRCSDGSVAAAGARRGDGQTVPASRGRLAASIGCVSHHRMVWGPPHRARTPALRPPTLARGQMSRCSDGSVALLLEPAAVTVKRFPRRVGDSPRRSGVCPTTAWCGVRLTALEHPRCGHPHLPVVKCRGARTGRSLLLLEPAAVTVKRFPCRVGDSPRRSGVCPTTAWCGVRLTALEHPRCGHPHLPVVKCRGARTGRSLLLLEPAAVTVKRLPRRVGDSPRRSGVCPTTAWCGVRLTALEHPRCGHPHAPVVKCRGARTGRSLCCWSPPR